MEEQDISELFLINFVLAVIRTRAQDRNFKEIPEDNQELRASLLKSEFQERNKIRMVPQFLKPIQITKQPQPIKIIPKRTKLPDIDNYRGSAQLNQNMQNQKTSIEKLNYLIKDPSINEIECIDSDNSLLIKRAGMTQKTQIKLSIEEIYELIAEFSQKTRIPIVNGTIKAALNNLIITAVLSESLGPRFIIQKKKPFQDLI